jgi:Right handed beta helix region
MFKKLGALAALSAAVAAAIFLTLPAQNARSLDGGASRTWVSGVGDDANPCSRTAPCKTFAGAISKTASYGTIDCLDPGGFGGVTITKSISIDCHEVYGSALVAGTNAIVINFDAFAADDAEKTVRLRNLNILGLHSGLTAVKILGGSATNDTEVMISDCLIDDFQGASPSYGIYDQRSGGGDLSVQNTTIRNIGTTSTAGAAGIFIAPATGNTTIKAAIDNVHVENSTQYGIHVKNGVHAEVDNSYFTGNGHAGILAENDSLVNADHITSSDNGLGLQAFSPAELRIADSDINMNGTGLSGTITSFGTNRIWGNTTAGTAPTPAGAAVNAKGQQ